MIRSIISDLKFDKDSCFIIDKLIIVPKIREQMIATPPRREFPDTSPWLE